MWVTLHNELHLALIRPPQTVSDWDNHFTSLWLKIAREKSYSGKSSGNCCPTLLEYDQNVTANYHIAGNFWGRKVWDFVAICEGFSANFWGVASFGGTSKRFVKVFLRKFYIPPVTSTKFPSIWYHGTPRSMSLNSACILICSLTTNSFFEILVWAWKEVHLQEPSCHINSNITS